jgi:hypothetical protein
VTNRRPAYRPLLLLLPPRFFLIQDGGREAAIREAAAKKWLDFAEFNEYYMCLRSQAAPRAASA